MTATTTREQAIRFTMGVLRNATDWQEGQHALADSDRFGPWVEEQARGDALEAVSVCQSIIREAEERLGDALPY